MQLFLKNDTKNTSVPNKFIECSLSAPENYTQSYLLGLMYSSTNQRIDFELFCARLSMSRQEVMESYEYWQKKGFARIINSDDFCLEFGDFNKYEDDLYTEREFNQQLQGIFGSRQLSPHEYLKIYDYTDMFGLPKKVVLLLAEYCVLMKGRRVSVAYMDKVAKSWAEEENVDTEEKAREWIASYKTASSGIVRVLKQLGISGREPSKDEEDLYYKWTHEWGFTLESILTACSHTTAAREPSMKYLDRILERLNIQGSTTSRKIAEKKIKSEAVTGDIQVLMRIIGEKSLTPSLEYESLYNKWTSVYGYGMDMLQLAARISGENGKKPFPYIDDVLTEWYNNRIFSAEDARNYISKKQEQDGNIEAVFKAAGILRNVADAHRRAYKKWTEEFGLSRDAILLAAEISSLSDSPYRYLSTILSNWHDSGVRTLKDAQQETKKRPGKKGISQGISSERASYERPTENYDHLAIDFFRDEGA
jgi:DnaD/phage-associated family protein